MRVAGEYKRLLALFDGIDENKFAFVKNQVSQLAWYNIEIARLQKSISKDGLSKPFQNGRNQNGWQVNPDLKALCDLQKHANTIVKTLLPLVPDKPSQFNKLAEFQDYFDCDDHDEMINGLPLNLSKV